MIDTLRATLFPGDGEHTYAVLDGASCHTLLDQLDEHQPEHVCLYAGKLRPGLARCAPYLVTLSPDDPFTGWLFAEGFGKHWGIFARSPAGLRALRKHFRTFLLVRSPERKTVYFRYYDPRILQVYLPTCNAHELAYVFGPVSAYFYEQVKPPALLDFRHEQTAATRERLAAMI